MREKQRNSDIDKNRADEAPGQSKECPNMKFVNSLSPSGITENLELIDLIDVQTIRPLMDDFYKLVHTPIGINDLKGNVLVGVGWQDICTKFHRVHPEACKHCIESDIELSASVLAGKFKLYKCKNNMWDMTTPIIVGGQHIGYVFSGQFFFEEEPLDYELFRSQARKYGFNEEEYIAALERVPRLSRESVDTAMSFLMTFANMVSQLGYRNLELAQSLEERDSLVNELQESERALEKAYNAMEGKVKERTAELERAYNSLKESEKRLAEAQRMAHIGSYDWNIKTNEEYWSEEVYRIFRLDPRLKLNHDMFLKSIHPEDLGSVNHALNEALNGKPYHIDYRIILPSGKERIIYSQGGVIFDEKNTPVRMRGIVQDVTEHKKAEENLTRIEIARKKEIHHRIKNNLQVISSLLDLQAEKFNNRECVKDSEIIEAFKESQDRVTSISLIHEELHEEQGTTDTLNFSLYLQRLVENLFQTYKFGNTRIRLDLDLEENIFFDMDTAVPLGMIVNELISNSLKYAFLDSKTGEIGIKLFSEETVGQPSSKKESTKKGTKYTLIVSDNGVGIPEEIDFENPETLGLQLVNLLVDQLDGTIELKRDHGTEFTIGFNNIEA